MVMVLDAPILLLLLLPTSCPYASFDVTEYDGMTKMLTGMAIDNDVEKIITTRAAVEKRQFLVLQL